MLFLKNIYAKCAEWTLQYRSGRQLILTGLDTLSHPNTLQIIVVITALEIILPKPFHFANIKTDPEMLSGLPRALQLVLKPHLLGISLPKK